MKLLRKSDNQQQYLTHRIHLHVICRSLGCVRWSWRVFFSSNSSSPHNMQYTTRILTYELEYYEASDPGFAFYAFLASRWDRANAAAQIRSINQSHAQMRSINQSISQCVVRTENEWKRHVPTYSLVKTIANRTWAAQNEKHLIWKYMKIHDIVLICAD